MKIQKAELVKALEIVKPGLASKEMIEQSTSFCFLDGKVITYNDEISISCPLENFDIEGAVNANEFYAILNKIKKDEIEISTSESELLLKSGRIKAGLTLHAEIVLPINEIGKVEKWKKLPDNFTKAITFSMASCSRDMSRPVLTCVHLNDVFVEASDNYRIVRFEMSQKFPIKNCLIPANVCSVLSKMNVTHISDGESWIHFKTNEGAVISCRTIEDKFPDLSKFLHLEGKKINFPPEISEILERASVFSKRDHILDESVNIKLQKNRLSVKSSSDSGWFEEKSRVPFDEDIDFIITPYLFKDILKQNSDAIIGNSMILFTGENWKYLSKLK